LPSDAATQVVVWGDNSPVRRITCGADECGGHRRRQLQRNGAEADGQSRVGDNTYGQTNVSPGLTNVWPLQAGTVQLSALKADGTVVGVGNNSTSTNVPADLTNVVAIASG